MTFRPDNMPAFASVYLGKPSARDPRASPLFGDARGLPPVLIQIGSTGLLLDDTRRMHERIREAGGASTLMIYRNVAHGWHLLGTSVPKTRTAIEEVARFARASVAEGVSRAVSA